MIFFIFLLLSLFSLSGAQYAIQTNPSFEYPYPESIYDNKIINWNTSNLQRVSLHRSNGIFSCHLKHDQYLMTEVMFKNGNMIAFDVSFPDRSLTMNVGTMVVSCGSSVNEYGTYYISSSSWTNIKFPVMSDCIFKISLSFINPDSLNDYQTLYIDDISQYNLQYTIPNSNFDWMIPDSEIGDGAVYDFWGYNPSRSGGGIGLPNSVWQGPTHDSNFMFIQNGVFVDFNINSTCDICTLSFIMSLRGYNYNVCSMSSPTIKVIHKPSDQLIYVGKEFTNPNSWVPASVTFPRVINYILLTKIRFQFESAAGTDCSGLIDDIHI